MASPTAALPFTFFSRTVQRCRKVPCANRVLAVPLNQSHDEIDIADRKQHCVIHVGIGLEASVGAERYPGMTPARPSRNPRHLGANELVPSGTQE